MGCKESNQIKHMPILRFVQLVTYWISIWEVLVFVILVSYTSWCLWFYSHTHLQVCDSCHTHLQVCDSCHTHLQVCDSCHILILACVILVTYSPWGWQFLSHTHLEVCASCHTLILWLVILVTYWLHIQRAQVQSLHGPILLWRLIMK